MKALRGIGHAHGGFQLMFGRLFPGIQLRAQTGIGGIAVSPAGLITRRLDEQYFLFVRKLIQLGGP